MRLALLAALVPALAFGKPPPIEKHVLENGLTVLVVESHAVPLVTIEIASKNGSMTEPPEYNGLSHLYEHMFFKANSKLPDQEAWLSRARELGLQWNGTTNTERVNYFVTTTSDHLGGALDFMRDAIVTPLFDPKELERERVVVTGEIDRNESNPFYFFFHALQQHEFWKFPSRKDPLGNRQTVLTATVEKLRVIQQRYYLPNNSVLVVTGDVNAQEIFAQTDKLFAGWARGKDPFVEFPLVSHPPIPKTEVVLVEQPVQTVVGTFGWHGPSTVGEHVDLTYAADLQGFVLGEPSSRFQRDLVDSGACLRVGMSWLTQMNTGPISLSFEAAPEKVDGCIKAILAELPRMREPGYLSPAELKNAVHHAEVNQARTREQGAGLAHDLTFWWCSAGLDYYLSYVDRLAQSSEADIARYMDTFILGKPFVLGVMLSHPSVAAGLSQQHFEELIGLQKKEAVR